MRLANFELEDRATVGIVQPTGLVDLGSRIANCTCLRDILDLEAGVASVAVFENDPPDHRLDAVSFLPTIQPSSKLLGVGLNYRDHAAELGLEIPEFPSIFVRFPDSVVGHLHPVIKPRESDSFDYEGELAVIIGRHCRRVRRDAALSFVAGYCCFNDCTARDWQRHSSQYTPGKNYSRSGAVGPWMSTADEVQDPGNLRLTTTYNGRVVQDGTTASMIYDIPALIEYITTFTELAPGDVIATGTPAGVGFGREPKLYMQPGDVIEVAIEGLGNLRNIVAADEPDR